MNGDSGVRRRVWLAVVTGVVVLSVVPSVALAQAHLRFGDVSEGYAHGPGIEWVADAGITTGCGNGSNYCPTDAVTRAQMATFLYRASGHAPGIAPSFDAATLEGHNLVEVIRSAAPMWAVVDANGTLARSSAGVMGVARTANGAYNVVFARNVRPCAYTVTNGLSGAAGTPPLGHVAVVGASGDTNAVFVATWDQNDVRADRGFHLTVAC